MDIKKIKNIVKLIDDSAFTEFHYKDDEIEIFLKKETQINDVDISKQIVPQPIKQISTMKEEVKLQEKETTNDPNLVEITSPMIATFYRAPSPTSKPYVEVGDEVKKGDVLCILEAMKIMNELETEFPCKIEKILVENAARVEFDQPLFLVRKIG